MREFLELSMLEKRILNGPLIGNIKAVLNMIDTETVDSYYKLKPSMISIQEELAFSELYEDSIYDNLGIAMQRGTSRFIYLPDRIGLSYNQFTVRSEVSKSNNTFTTYFIGKDVKEIEMVTRFLVSTIIGNAIDDYLDEEYGYLAIDIVNSYGTALCNIDNPAFYNDMIGMIDLLVCYYKAMDVILDLKFDNESDIVKVINEFRADDDKLLLAVESLCYRYAITTDHNPGDLKELYRNCAAIYTNYYDEDGKE